jgi:membrane peptidoglycan carboxypeptidase
VPKIVGGSTITQQLAKNLLLSGERTVLRKAQELVLALMLEGLLSKERILEIYLNNVEWGEGVFGAQAAARHYFRVDAAQLAPQQAARLAVMLPAPKRFEKRPASPYLLSRSATIVARMNDVEVPKCGPQARSRSTRRQRRRSSCRPSPRRRAWSRGTQPPEGAVRQRPGKAGSAAMRLIGSASRGADDATS